MSFLNSAFIILVTAGPVFVIGGYILLRFPPKEINPTYGYRTRRSMRSQAHWDFAQRFSAIDMMKLGGLLTICGLIGYAIPMHPALAVLISLGLMIAAVVMLFRRTEHALKRRFHDPI